MAAARGCLALLAAVPQALQQGVQQALWKLLHYLWAPLARPLAWVQQRAVSGRAPEERGPTSSNERAFKPRGSPIGSNEQDTQDSSSQATGRAPSAVSHLSVNRGLDSFVPKPGPLRKTTNPERWRREPECPFRVTYTQHNTLTSSYSSNVETWLLRAIGSRAPLRASQGKILKKRPQVGIAATRFAHRNILQKKAVDWAKPAWKQQNKTPKEGQINRVHSYMDHRNISQKPARQNTNEPRTKTCKKGRLLRASVYRALHRNIPSGRTSSAYRYLHVKDGMASFVPRSGPLRRTPKPERQKREPEFLFGATCTKSNPSTSSYSSTKRPWRLSAIRTQAPVRASQAMTTKEYPQWHIPASSMPHWDIPKGKAAGKCLQTAYTQIPGYGLRKAKSPELGWEDRFLSSLECRYITQQGLWSPTQVPQAKSRKEHQLLGYPASRLLYGHAPRSLGLKLPKMAGDNGHLALLAQLPQMLQQGLQQTLGKVLHSLWVPLARRLSWGHQRAAVGCTSEENLNTDSNEAAPKPGGNPTVQDGQDTQDYHTQDSGSARSAFRRLRVNGVLASFVPKPGPLRRTPDPERQSREPEFPLRVTFTKCNPSTSCHSSTKVPWVIRAIRAQAPDNESQDGQDTQDYHTHESGSARSAFRRLRVNGVLASFVPRPGPLRRTPDPERQSREPKFPLRVTFTKCNPSTSSHSSTKVPWVIRAIRAQAPVNESQGKTPREHPQGVTPATRVAHRDIPQGKSESKPLQTPQAKTPDAGWVDRVPSCMKRTISPQKASGQAGGAPHAKSCEEGQLVSTQAARVLHSHIPQEKAASTAVGKTEFLKPPALERDPSRPQKRKATLPLPLPCKRRKLLILPEAPDLGCRVTAKEVDDERHVVSY